MTKLKQRRQLTIGEVIDFLSKLPRGKKVFVAPSIVNVCAPPSRQEFIMSDEKMKVTVIEVGAEVVIGFVA